MMDEERKARLEKMAATKRFRLAMEKDEERKARLEKVVAIPHSSGWPWRQRKKEDKKEKNGFDLDLI